MHTYGCFGLMLDRKQHSSVKQLSFNLKKKNSLGICVIPEESPNTSNKTGVSSSVFCRRCA